jgi:cytochrome c oxidase subunit 2
MRHLIIPSTAALILCVVAARGTAQGQKAEPKRIEITASKFEFSPSRIEVKSGETIELIASSTDAKHGIECKALGIKKATFEKDKPATITFTAAQPGTYEFKCANYCGSGHGRMKGQIVVSP